MHIHAGNLNPGLHSEQATQSALAASRASQTRKKLFEAASDLDAASIVTDPWAISMAGAFAGSQGGGSAQDPSAETESPAVEEAAPKTRAVSPVSYWA